MHRLLIVLAILSACRTEKNNKTASVAKSSSPSSLTGDSDNEGSNAGTGSTHSGTSTTSTTSSTSQTQSSTITAQTETIPTSTPTSTPTSSPTPNCDPYNDVVPVAKEKLAILYLVPTDIPDAWKLSKNELTDHFFTPCTSPLKKFWSEVSHGKYQYTGDVFVQNFPVTKAAIMSNPKTAVSDMIFDLSPNSDLAVDGLDPTKYDTIFFFLASNIAACSEPQPNMCHFGGGFNGANPQFKINGITLNSGNAYKKIISFVFFGNKTPPTFEFYRPDQVFEGKGNGDGTNYPELGLWGDDFTTLHEWGHSIGMRSHASYYYVDQEPLGGILHFTNISFGSMGEDYGNYFDIMGAPMGRLAMHFNAGQQDKLGWYNDAQNSITQITASQNNVTISPLEGNGAVRAAVIKAPGNLSTSLDTTASNTWGTAMAAIDVQPKYYIEYRQPVGFDKHLGHTYVSSNTTGLFIHLSIPNLNASEQHTYLLNMGPIGNGNVVTSNGYYKDHHLPALLPGKRFYNASSKVLIKNVRPNGSTNISFDVVLGNDIPSGIPEGVSNE